MTVLASTKTCSISGQFTYISITWQCNQIDICALRLFAALFSKFFFSHPLFFKYPRSGPAVGVGFDFWVSVAVLG